ncbi:fimb protein [soil metagenome]
MSPLSFFKYFVRVRVRTAKKIFFIHLACSFILALLSAILVFGLWYPYPYNEISGGREIFLLIIGVDVVCGPLLTLVLFSPSKKKSELRRDLGLVLLIQLGALGFGLFTVWQARPLFLVMERERFKVVAKPDLRLTSDPLAVTAWAKLSGSLKPKWFEGPKIVALRESINENESTQVMIDYTLGGRDFSDRPEFYIPYSNVNALKFAKPLEFFLKKYPALQVIANRLALEKGASIATWSYLPIVARKDWVVILGGQGQIEGFLPGKAP